MTTAQTRVAIVYHSGYGHTKKVAEAVAAGSVGALLAIDTEGNLNGDKFSTLTYFFTLSQQHGMLWVGSGMHPSNAKAHSRDDINNLGGYAGLITATPSDASVDEMVPGDIATAKAFGRRIAEATAKFAG